MWVSLVLVAGWMVIAIASLVDLQFGTHLYSSSVAYDFSFRTAITAAAAKTIPPANPFFASVPPVLLKYHFFWMLLCGLASHLGVGPRHALLAGTVWGGFALMCAVAVSLKFLTGVRERLGRKVLIACGLLAITGLDILPTTLLYFRYHTVYQDMEWWNEQITSWVDTLLWAPHHIAGLVACMVGFLAIREAASSKFDRGVSIAVAGCAFASACGLSVLVTFTFALFLVLWISYAAVRRWWDDVLMISGAGAVALCLAWPFLVSILGPEASGSDGAGASHFFALTTRGFPLAIDYFASILEVSPLKLSFLSVPLLPLNYLLELGFFLLVAVLRFQSLRDRSTPFTAGEVTGWLLVATSFLVGTFVRSTTLGSNDLGWRCFLQAQLVLLVWAAIVVDDWWTAQRFREPGRRGTAALAVVLLGLGAMGTTYQLTMLRVYPILLDQGKIPWTKSWWLDRDGKLGERNYMLRSAYEQLSLILSPDALVQYNPDAAAFIANELYSLHPVAMGDSRCGAVFGGSTAECQSRAKAIVPLFNAPLTVGSSTVDEVCREYGISVLLVRDTDPVWRDTKSWVWSRTPLLANNRVRVFACGGRPKSEQLRAAK
jgi:hypothetical protein